MAKKGGASRRRFPVLPTVLLTAAILGLPTIVYAWGRTSSSFTIDRVRVSGTELVSHARVVRLLREDYRGENLFTVTTRDVRESLASLAYVEDVRVDRDFPDTLRVRVIEHQPALYVLGANGWFVVADDGYVICPAGEAARSATGSGGSTGGDAAAGSSGASPQASPAATPAASPSADGGHAKAVAATDVTHVEKPPAALKEGPPHAALRLPGLALGDRLRQGATLTQPAAAAALHVVEALPMALRRDVAIVQVTPAGDVALRFDGGMVVRWGDRQRALAKMLALKAVLGAYRRAGRQPTFLDVSVPDRVLARPILK